MPDAAADRPVYRRPPLLVFVHIPKTAGTMLTTILSMNEPGRRSRAIANVFKGGGGTKEGARFRRLRSEGAANINELRVLHGHFPLGMRQHFPKRLPRKREVRYFTFLREPTDRMLSHFFAIRDQREEPGDTNGGQRRPPLSRDATLEDALEGGYVHDNLQTRMLSGLAEPFGEVDEEMLENAKRNLREELVFFGLTERFDESLVLAKRRLGLRSILYTPRGEAGRKRAGRVNTARPRGEEVPADLRRTAEEANRFDIELYRYARDLFDAIEERGEFEFELELAALQVAKGKGDIEPTRTPAPQSYGGDAEGWQMLVHARATSMRRERELAETWAVAYELAQGDPGVLVKLGRIKEIQAAGGADDQPDSKSTRKAVRAMRRALDDGTLEPEPEPEPARGRRGRKRRARRDG